MPARDFLNIVEEILREDAVRLYAGHPEELQNALDDIDDMVGSGTEEPAVVSLHSVERDAAWAAMGD